MRYPMTNHDKDTIEVALSSQALFVPPVVGDVLLLKLGDDDTGASYEVLSLRGLHDSTGGGRVTLLATLRKVG